jgi:CRISPR system Cascade subunit CasE
MYLSKAELARGSKPLSAWASLLNDSAKKDKSHKLVWTLFAGDSDARRDFLWREIETGSYMLLSKREPSDATGIWRIASKPFAPALAPGDRLRFSLRANPAQTTKKAGLRSVGNRPRGVRVDAVMHTKKAKAASGGKPFTAEEREEAALAWLYAREERLGVTFDRQLCSAGGYGVIRAGWCKDGEITFGAIDYEGVLEVREPDRLMAALNQGIGKAKAYGCGLMLIRRV